MIDTIKNIRFMILWQRSGFIGTYCYFMSVSLKLKSSFQTFLLVKQICTFAEFFLQNEKTVFKFHLDMIDVAFSVLCCVYKYYTLLKLMYQTGVLHLITILSQWLYFSIQNRNKPLNKSWKICFICSLKGMRM